MRSRLQQTILKPTISHSTSTVFQRGEEMGICAPWGQSFPLGRWKVLETDGGHGHRAVWMSSTPQDCALGHGLHGTFCVACIFPQSQNLYLLGRRWKLPVHFSLRKSIVLRSEVVLVYLKTSVYLALVLCWQQFFGGEKPILDQQVIIIRICCCASEWAEGKEVIVTFAFILPHEGFSFLFPFPFPFPFLCEEETTAAWGWLVKVVKMLVRDSRQEWPPRSELWMGTPVVALGLTWSLMGPTLSFSTSQFSNTKWDQITFSLLFFNACEHGL